MIAARLRADGPALRYLGLVALAIAMRVVIAGEHPESSQPAALVFAVLLAAIVVSGRASLPARSQLRVATAGRSLAFGLAGSALLIFFPYRAVGFAGWAAHPTTQLLAWTLLVSAVAVTEELVFRGLLFGILRASHGTYAAVVICAISFAAIHVPLYGWGALPLDVAVGLWLGAIRLWGGVGASAISHTVADLATGWLVI